MHFVIAGRANCSQFVYASMIAQRLKENLPEFTYSRISKKSGDWEKWLLKTCKENDWYHIKSPIIWREISMVKGKKYYVGDVTKFLDLCQDHYGLTRQMLTGERFGAKEMEWFRKRSEAELAEEMKLAAARHVNYRCRQVCILGAGCQASDILIMELLHIPLQNRENGLEIRLFDEPKREKKLQAMATDAKHCLGQSGLGSCRVAANMREALYNADLVIVLDSFPRRADESLVKWLKRNRNAMAVLGMALNKYAKAHCRVVIGSPSNQPVCYNANVLATFATKLHVRNIVVVTQDLGRETLHTLSKRTGLDLKNLYCPPVWGFVGLNRYVDVKQTLHNFTFKVPGPRMSSHLAQGSEEQDIRTAEPFLKEKDINEIFLDVITHKCVSFQVESTPRLGRVTHLAKITAILDLLRVWRIGREDGNGEIISLGVYSDGTFNIPEGLYWSQPVTLEKGFWKPFARYPVPRKLDINLESFFVLGQASLAETGVEVRTQRDPVPTAVPPKRKKSSSKFDLELLEKSVNFPVIRTRADCLEQLKRIAADEYGLDLGVPELLPTISEESIESEMEDIPPEKIYCECWRSELLQLRRIAIEASTSSEVEVDLGENLSGSEWSVINPTLPNVPARRSRHVPSVKAQPPSVKSEEPEESSGKHEEEQPDEVQEEGEESDEPAKIKEVRFDPNLGPCAGKRKHRFKFYGTKDAIVDETKKVDMRRRIKRYEMDGEELEEEESEESWSLSSYETIDFDFFTPKFHVSLDGDFEIVGDPQGLEALEEMRKSVQRDSSEDFTKMWSDEVTPTLQVLVDSDSVTSSTVETNVTEPPPPQLGPATMPHAPGPDGDAPRFDDMDEYAGEYVLGEDELHFRTNLEVIPEEYTEEEEDELKVEAVVAPAIAEAPSAVRAEVTAAPLPEQEMEESKAAEEGRKKKKRKWEGVPKCCLCHCIVPEGELGCHCGETRVMEVFKKPSSEVIADSEEEYIVVEPESVHCLPEEVPPPEPPPPPEPEPEPESEPEPERKGRDIFSLPPESFFPFSPRPVNKFVPSKRPEELQKAAGGKPKPPLPPKYMQLINDSKKKILEKIVAEEAAAERKREKRASESGDSLAVGEELRYELHEKKTVFLGSPELVFGSVEDWRTGLRKKYKHMFKTSTLPRDELYYDMAIEEPSDDECDLETEEHLKKYFED